MSTYGLKRRRRLILIVCFLFFCVVISCIGVIKIVNSGTHYNKEEIPSKEEVVYTGSVKLSSIVAPKFLEEFCTLTCATGDYKVYWGDTSSDEMFKMWYSSGYPGFGMPMIIEGSEFSVEQQCSLSTDYGVFLYKVLDEGMALVIDGELVNLETEEKIVNYGVSREYLFLFDKNSNKFWVLRLIAGTEIIT